MLDGGALVNWLVSMAGAPRADVARIPAQIAELAAGHPNSIAESLIAGVPTDGLENLVGYGIKYGVYCAEYTPYDSEAEILSAGRRAFPGYPRSVLAQAPQAPFIFDDCRAWNVPSRPVARNATRSKIPTLILSGTFDSVTALSWPKASLARFPTRASCRSRAQATSSFRPRAVRYRSPSPSCSDHEPRRPAVWHGRGPRSSAVRLHPGEKRTVTLLADPARALAGSTVEIEADPGLSVSLHRNQIPEPGSRGTRTVQMKLRARATVEPGVRLNLLAAAGEHTAELELLIVRNRASSWVREIARKNENQTIETEIDPDTGSSRCMRNMRTVASLANSSALPAEPATGRRPRDFSSVAHAALSTRVRSSC